MKLEAKQRLQADDAKDKRRAIQDKIEDANDKVKELKKGLPSKYNRAKVPQGTQINIRKQVLHEKGKVQDLQQQKLRLKGK